ncbi:hypothetical protein Q5H91_10700 [Sphingomonas sp. KR1UV-12]|uniref:Lipoprotein n=1 Tax=Sphingomonas aurea TaxID=3063994 RepID=A0ABT9EM17_9SPHN|nr:hypothetical protein [Sphingomonas sp. KR1UV-12]MDP1027683.1 hypothetical protein [Sphingomonas sp. KR1UV-12]
MIRYCAASLLLLPLLAGCDRQPVPAANTAAAATNEAAAPEEGYAAKIRALPAGQRDGVFLRAVRDSKESCQEVTNEYEINPMQGKDSWAVTCDKTNHWVIAIDGDGNAQVTKVSATSRLPAKGS